MSQASAVNRSLGNIRTELDFLLDSKVISQDLFNEFNRKLPKKYGDNNNGNNNGNKNNKSKQYAEVLYAFQPQQDTDLALVVGEKIEIVEKLSESWYKGKKNGKIGTFPANYVKVMNGSDKNHTNSTSRPGAPTPANSYNSQSGAPPYVQQQQQYYAPPQEKPQQQQQQQQAQQQQQHHHQHGEGAKLVGKFARKFGNAAIWGAGSTVGSDIVNSIFK